MSTLFISHSRRDAEAAKELRKRLGEKGHDSVFLDFDPDGIQLGAGWERTLYTKLRACRAVIALCSDNYLDSHWCFAEIALARMEGKQIFAFKIDPWSGEKKMPSILKEGQYGDLRAESEAEEAYQRLWRGFQVKGITPEEHRGVWGPANPPYPGLRAFEEKDARIFFGRDREVREGVELLTSVRRLGQPRVVMVLGASGSGKSSLVRAGIVPRLRRDASRWRIVGPFRPGARPLRELAAALSRAFTKVGQPVPREEIHRQLEPSVEAPALEARPKPTDAVVRRRLLSALEAFEGQLTAADATILESVGRLRRRLERRRPEAAKAEAETPAAGPNPLGDLATRLRLAADEGESGEHRDEADGAQDAAVVLVIDQFEELLGTDTEDQSDPEALQRAEARTRFLELLRDAVEADDDPPLVLGTMRSDFLGALQKSTHLQGVGFKSLSVGPMSRKGRQEIIEGPAALGQLKLGEGLVDELLHATDDPAALPLLAFTLRLLWERFHERRLLELRDYKELGKIEGAIKKVAKETLEAALALEEGDEKILRKAFLSLARSTEEGTGWARRPASWDGLTSAAQKMLKLFVDSRLLVQPGVGTVEVAHEALFSSWPRLAGWLEEHRGQLLLRDRVWRDAKSWEESRRKAETVWRGGRLDQAAELMESGGLRDSNKADDTAERFVRAGLKRRLIQRATRFGIAALFFVGLAVGLYLVNEERKNAQEQARIAKSRQLAPQASVRFKSEPDLAFLLSLEAASIFPGPETERTLLSGLRSNWPLEFVFAAPGNGSLAFSPNGQLLAAASGKQVLLLEAATGAPVGTLPPPPNSGPRQSWSRVAFSPRGNLLAATARSRALVLWNVDDGTLIGETPKRSCGGPIAFDTDGGRVGCFGSARGVWETRCQKRAAEEKPGCTLSEVESPPIEGTGLAASADGARLASFRVGKHPEGEYLVLDTWSGSVLGTFEGRRASGSHVSLGRDGARLAFEYEGETQVWDTSSRERLGSLNSDGAIASITLDPTGQYLAVKASLRETREIRVWDFLERREYPVRTLGSFEAYPSLAFSPDVTEGVRLAARGGSEIRLWNLGAGEPLRELEDWTFDWRGEGAGYEIFDVPRVFMRPDGKLVAIGEDQRSLWEVGSEEFTPFDNDHGELRAFAFSPRGGAWPDRPELRETLMVSQGGDKVTVWQASSGDVVQTFPDTMGAKRVLALAPDGARLAASGEQGTVLIGEVDSDTSADDPDARGELTPLEGHGSEVRVFAFSPDGARLASGDQDGTVILWDLERNRPLAGPLEGHDNLVFGLSFSPDGMLLASSAGDQTIRLWDGTTGEPLGQLRGDAENIHSVAFSPDGTHLVSFHCPGKQGRCPSGTVVWWNLDVASWKQLACKKANRNFTASEWRRFFGPDELYRRTCDRPIHPSVIRAGQDLARAGDVKGAAALFRHLKTLDPTLEIDLQSEAERHASQETAGGDGGPVGQ